MKEIKLVMTRDCSLIATQAWYQGHRETWQFYGFNFKDLFFVFDGSAVQSYRALLPFQKELPEYLGKWLKNEGHQKIMFDQFERYINTYQNTRTKVTHLPRRTDAKNALENIESAYQSILDAFVGLLAIFWLPEWQDAYRQKRGNLLPQNLVDRSIGIRETQKEAFYDDVVDIIDHYLALIARIFGWSTSDLRLVTLTELKGAIKIKKLPLSIIKQRKQGYLYIDNDVYPIDQLQNILKKHGYKLVQDRVVFNGTLKGVVGQNGKARGRVQIIRSKKEYYKFKTGNILVAPMTTPRYVPLMKLAAAIVTDEGGITSHAAIVSRELGIPCIIATKIATTVLKDGDIVEVDANKGVVRKID